MQINHEITMHLDRRVPTPVLDAVQGETARSVTLWLYDQALPWNVPEGANVLIRYRKPDCTGGVYDSLPDGTRAWEFWDNAVQIRLAPQALAVAGITAMQIAIVAEGEELASFVFHIRVESDPSVGTLASQDYVNIGQWLMPYIQQLISRAEVAAEEARRAADQVLALAGQISGKFGTQFAFGCIDAVTGEVMASSHAIVSQYIAPMGQGLGVSFPSLVTARLFFYDADLVYVGADLMRTESFEQQLPEEAQFVRVEVRFASGKIVTDVEELARYVTVYLPDNCLQHVLAAQEAAKAAQEAAQAAAEDAAGSIKSVNGITPDKDGNVTVEVGGNAGMAQPLKFMHLTEEGTSWTTAAIYDGTEETVVYLPNQVTHITETNGRTIKSADGLCHFDGSIKVASLQDRVYHFDDAYGVGIYNGGHRRVYIADPFNNTQYLFKFTKGSAINAYTVVTAPLVSESSTGSAAELQPLTFTGAVNATYDGTTPISVEIPAGGSGGGNAWQLVQSITTEENVSSVTVTLPADNTYQEVYLTFRNNLVTDANGTTGGQAAATMWVNDAAVFVQKQLFNKAWSSTSVILTRDGTDVNAKWRKYGTGTGGDITEFISVAFKKELMEKIQMSLTDADYIFTAGCKVEVWAR